MRVQLHVYPVTHDIQKALIVSQVVLYTEMKDDRTQVEQAITFFNLGRTAWVPDDLVIGLPDGFTALNGQQGMGGEGIEPVERRGARVRGTFGPGQHTIDFRWQLPYEGEREISFEETLPPNVAVARALAAASQEMRLVVSGFPEAQARTDSNGERILVTERQMRREDPPLTKLHVELRDLPTAGPWPHHRDRAGGIRRPRGRRLRFLFAKAGKPAVGRERAAGAPSRRPGGARTSSLRRRHRAEDL